MKKETRKKRNRSGNAPCDICEEKHILQAHHIRGRKIPNPNHPSNVCNICPNCHINVHEALIIIEDWITTSVGKELMWHKKDEENFTGREAKTYLVGKTPKGLS